MSANVIFASNPVRRAAWAWVVFLSGLWLAWPAVAGDDVEQAEMSVARLMQPLEKAGYDFRADVWERELKPDVGKAVRLQLFKGNEYKICVAVGEPTGVQIEAHVIDANGTAVESAKDSRGWGVVLTVKPKRTGVYVVTIRQAGGKAVPVTCAMIMGYK